MVSESMVLIWFRVCLSFMPETMVGRRKPAAIIRRAAKDAMEAITADLCFIMLLRFLLPPHAGLQRGKIRRMADALPFSENAGAAGKKRLRTSFCVTACKSVSYTHLDVYKRQTLR